jgi:glycosyltransferase involved in cell wall biosynthesis
MIVSEVGGLPELVQDRRFVVPPGDPHVLANAMTLCLDNPAVLRNMASDAESISTKYSWTEIAKQTEKIYKLQLQFQY